jgi:hypothetical protein
VASNSGKWHTISGLCMQDFNSVYAVHVQEQIKKSVSTDKANRKAEMTGAGWSCETLKAGG